MKGEEVSHVSLQGGVMREVHHTMPQLVLFSVFDQQLVSFSVGVLTASPPKIAVNNCPKLLKKLLQNYYKKMLSML